MPITPEWVALSLVEHLGSKRLRALLAAFDDDLGAILRADAAALRRVHGIGPKIAASILALDVTPIAAALPHWQAAGITLLALDDPGYPPLLAQIEDAPPTLMLRGALPLPYRGVAVVGTRSPSVAAAVAARRLAENLAQRGYVIVSGLARGIDGIAHRAALSVAHGRTLAVLGSGVLAVYPPEHLELAGRIIERGALLSEVEPEANPKPSALVARNRMITGLSEAVIVVETELDGGAMHAARRAAEQGRRVFTLESEASGNRELLATIAFPISPELDGFLLTEY